MSKQNVNFLSLITSRQYTGAGKNPSERWICNFQLSFMPFKYYLSIFCFPTHLPFYWSSIKYIFFVTYSKWKLCILILRHFLTFYICTWDRIYQNWLDVYFVFILLFNIITINKKEENSLPWQPFLLDGCLLLLPLPW